MKAINNIFSIKYLAMVAPVLVGVFFSCGNGSDILDSTDTQNINSVSTSSALFNEGSDMSANVIKGLTVAQYSGARVNGEVIANLGRFDGRLACAHITITRTGTFLNPSGTITINYDSLTTCSDSIGVKRRGKIIISYSGRKWSVGSSVTIQFQNFYRNFSKIEGTLSDTVLNANDTTSIQFVSRLDDGKITFADGDSVSRSHKLNRTWHRSVIRDNNEWLVLGAATGTNKKNGQYEMEITNNKPLVYRVICLKSKIFIPVSGEEKIYVGKNNYTIDFGSNVCDNLITVTVGSKVKVIAVTADGN
ncbi:MAG: hypothetical protein QM734_10595 [Cyclobacteriaceae bacterium]